MSEPEQTARFRVMRQLMVNVEVEVEADSVGEAIMRASLMATQRLDLGRGEWFTHSVVRLTPSRPPRSAEGSVAQLVDEILRETPDEPKTRE